MLQKIFIQDIINLNISVKLGRKKIEKLIKKIGIFRIKAKSIYLMSEQSFRKTQWKST